MILSVFFGLYLISAIHGESESSEGYNNQRSYEVESSSGRIYENSNPQGRISKFSRSETEEDVDLGKERQTPRRGTLDPEVADQLEGNGWLDVIPGTPGKDYPNYEKIPETSFTCDDKTPGGYYADIEARCQVFHVCNTGGQKSSFVCPSGSIFNQKYFVCDWWYDFECDDATDLYSLNEKINRGGTGSGPSGPGRVEQSVEYSSENGHFPREDLQNEGNFVSVDGFDLSLAGTGEGGPGYARNGNNKGYQSNVNDEDYKDKENSDKEGLHGRRRKNFNFRKTSGDHQSSKSKNEEINLNNQRNESPREFSHDSKRDGENFRKQNSNSENSRANYQENFNGPLKTDNFRNGNGGNDPRVEQSNGFIENRNSPRKYPSGNIQEENNNNNGNYPRRDTQKHENVYKTDLNQSENRYGFGQRSSAVSVRNGYNPSENLQHDYNRGLSSSSSSSGNDNKNFSNYDTLKEENGKDIDEGTPNSKEFNSDKTPGVPSGSNNNEYRNPSSGTRPGNIRGRQRTSGGLPGGLGNGYPSPGRARELPGSDAIASSITPAEGTVYDEGDQRSVQNYHQKTSTSGTRTPGQVTDLLSVTDSQKIVFDHRNGEIQRTDFREDNFSPEIDSHNDQSTKNRKYSTQSSSLRNNKSFDQNYHHERNGQTTDQRHQNSGKNYGNDYLVGIVPGTENRGNGSLNSNQPRRYLPIL